LLHQDLNLSLSSLQLLIAGVGLDIGKNSIGESTGFTISVAANPGVQDMDQEVRRFAFKVEAGAVVQVVNDVHQPDRVDIEDSPRTSTGSLTSARVSLETLAKNMSQSCRTEQTLCSNSRKRRAHSFPRQLRTSAMAKIYVGS
jgi:hypothetical protein